MKVLKVGLKAQIVARSIFYLYQTENLLRSLGVCQELVEMRLYLANIEDEIVELGAATTLARLFALRNGVLLHFVENRRDADQLVVELVVVGRAHEDLISAANKDVDDDERRLDEPLDVAVCVAVPERVLIRADEFEKQDETLQNEAPVEVEAALRALLVNQKAVDDPERHLVDAEREVLHQVRDEKLAADLQDPRSESIWRRFFCRNIAVSCRRSVEAQAELEMEHFRE